MPMSVMDSLPPRPWHRFPARMLAARLAAGLKQTDLAEACHRKGNSWVAQLEAGEAEPNKPPTLPRPFDDVYDIAAALGVPPEWLLFGRMFDAPGVAVVLGLGGPRVTIGLQHRAAELLLYPGSYQCRGFSRPIDGALFASLVIPKPDPRLRIYLQHNRGALVAVRGRLMEDMSVRGTDGSQLAGRNLVGTCWRLRRPSSPARPAR